MVNGKRKDNKKLGIVTLKKSGEGPLPTLHIRLCHHCLYLNEGLSDVGQCRRCGKHLTFDAFVEDLSSEELADLWMDEDLDEITDVLGKGDFAVSETKETSEGSSGTPPYELSGQIFGLSVIW